MCLKLGKYSVDSNVCTKGRLEARAAATNLLKSLQTFKKSSGRRQHYWTSLPQSMQSLLPSNGLVADITVLPSKLFITIHSLGASIKDEFKVRAQQEL